MKSLIQKIFFRKKAPRPFYGVRVALGEIKEKVFLIQGNFRLEVSDRHNIVCQSPFSIAIWLDLEEQSRFNAPKMQLEVVRDGRMLSRMDLELSLNIPGSKGSFSVFRIGRPRAFGLNPLYRFLLLRYFFSNEKLPLEEARIYAALYAYPRKVIITCFQSNDYYNMFPMDFQSAYPEEEMYLLGLKTSNITLGRIIESGRVLVAQSEDIDSKTVYELGAHHSRQPPPIESLPFRTQASERFGFPVPAFSSGYSELEIKEHHVLGSHTMLMGRVINRVERTKSQCALCHIHYFEYENSGYREV